LEEVIDLDLRHDVYGDDGDDGDDAYEDVDDGGPHDHTKPVKEGKEAKTAKVEKAEKPKQAKKAEKAEQGQQAVEGKPVDGGDEKDDDASSSDSLDSDDSDDADSGAPGVGANIGAPSAPGDDTGKVKVPKESHDTVVIGLKVYTNKDVGCSVGGKLRIGCKDPNCTLCEPPTIVTIPAAGEKLDDETNDAD